MASEGANIQNSQIHVADRQEDSRNRVIPPQDRTCAFCNMGHREGLEMSTDFIDRPNDINVWATDKPTLSIGKKPVWCHTNCVHFSPQTKYDDASKTWHYVGPEHNRARQLYCAICGERGASIGCSVTSCSVSVHFPCAIKELLPDGRRNWYPCQVSTMPFFCLSHSAERSEYEKSQEVTRLRDIARGKENEEIPLEMGLAYLKRKFSSACASPTSANGRGHGHGGGLSGAANAAADLASASDQWQRLYPGVSLPRGLLTKPRDKDFTYVSTTVNSKSAQVRQGPERGKRCCSCTGPAACRDPRKCECLRDGRHYSNRGRLLDEGHPRQIYECNLNCRCHEKDCRNRLVQGGMTYRIKVLYLGPSRHRVLEGCGKWGVWAVEDIPARSFVCTVAGQLVLADDLEDVLNHDGQRSTNVLVHRVKDWTELDKKNAGDSSDGFGGNDSSKGEDTRGDRGHSGQSKRPRLAPDAQDRYVDQRRYANISRYIRCARRKEDVNLLGVPVHTVNQDPDAPVLALFALKTIEAGTELLRSRK